MSKISISTSRILMSVGILAGLSANAEEIITKEIFENYFTETNGVWNLKADKKNEELGLRNIAIFDPNGIYDLFENKNLVINTENKVVFRNNFDVTSNYLDIEAKNGVEVLGQSSNTISFDTLNPFHVKGKFSATYTLFQNSHNNINIDGAANITNSLLLIDFATISDAPLKYNWANATSFNADVTSSNVAVGNYYQSAEQVISDNLRLKNTNFNTLTQNKLVASYIVGHPYKYGSANTIIENYFINTNKLPTQNELNDQLILYTLKVVENTNNKTLQAQATLNVNEKTLLVAKLEMAKQLLEQAEAIKYLLPSKPNSKYTQAEINEANELLDNIILELKGQNNNGLISALTQQYATVSTTTIGKLTQAPAQFSAIANGLSNIVTSKVDTATQAAIIELAMDSKKLASYLSDINSSAKSHTDAGSAVSSANTAINLSNDLSITARAVQHNNPYLAAKQFKDKTASVASDAYYYKANNYANSVWANTFGGLNIYDGENSGVFGISFGYDREVSEGVLLGVYGTYASSELKDKVTKNEADNFQFGVYSNIKFAQTWESNFKVYGQVAKVDTTSTTNVGTTQGDFAQRFFGASGNVGKVFNPADGFYIKPFVGANYYYGYTPNYTETGVLAKHVRSTSNDTLSLEIGG
ncbi:MAG: autotransporter outer membrane beta-barrel domain-containing protein, partial [Helicobacteraceae bacterium]|nr:autotransporter outer membrane beta-barrel domain-containing protein [Helicobacteraceae bacterium]